MKGRAAVLAAVLMASALHGSAWARGTEREENRREAARLAATIAALRSLQDAPVVRIRPTAPRTGLVGRITKRAATQRLSAPERGMTAGRRRREWPPVVSAPVVSAPVLGRVVMRYGQATEGGPASGVIYAPAPGAPVGAPCGGSIDFAGPFRSYGATLIVDCGRDRRFVLAGLDRIEVVVGAHVRRGERLGRMAADRSGTHDQPTLFVQERQGSATVDPARGARR